MLFVTSNEYKAENTFHYKSLYTLLSSSYDLINLKLQKKKGKEKKNTDRKVKNKFVHTLYARVCPLGKKESVPKINYTHPTPCATDCGCR